MKIDVNINSEKEYSNIIEAEVKQHVLHLIPASFAY